MKSKFLIVNILLMLIISTFCIGCGDSSAKTTSSKMPGHSVSMLDDEYEKVIKTCINQQLYYENKEANDFAEDIVFSTDAAMLPGHPPYFSGGILYISSKKELFSNIRYRLLPLTLLGYVSYEDLKKISSKFADLQERTEYSISETESDRDHKERHYKTYVVKIKHPDSDQINTIVTQDIYSELKSKFNVENIKVGETLFYNLSEIAKKSNAEQLEQYGNVIVKNYLKTLDSNKIPFSTEKKIVHIKDEGKTKSGKTKYVVPDTGSPGSIEIMELPLTAVWLRFGTSLDKGYGVTSIVDITFKKHHNDLPYKLPIDSNNADMVALSKNLQDFKNKGMNFKDLKSFESSLDEQEKIYDKLIPMVFQYIRGQSTGKMITDNTNTQNHSQQETSQNVTNNSSNNESNPDIEAAKQTFINYHKAITAKNYKEAYEMLSGTQKQKMGDIQTYSSGYNDTISSEVSDIKLLSSDNDSYTFAYILNARDRYQNNKVKHLTFSGQVVMAKDKGHWYIRSTKSTKISEKIE